MPDPDRPVFVRHWREIESERMFDHEATGAASRRRGRAIHPPDPVANARLDAQGALRRDAPKRDLGPPDGLPDARRASRRKET